MECIIFSSPGAKIGADPSLTGALTWLEWEEFFLKDPKNFTLQPIIQNPIDDIWFDRPQRPKEELEIHDIKFSGRSRLKTFKYYVTSKVRFTVNCFHGMYRIPHDQILTIKSESHSPMKKKYPRT